MNKIAKLFCGCLLGCGLAATFASCSDDEKPTYLDEVKVSSSYVAIPQDGGSAEITVTAADSWAFDTQRWIASGDTTYAAAPAWLKVSTTSGSAGQTTITFSAESTLNGRSCELLLTSGGKTQHINVMQGLSTVESATCAEVIAGPDSKTYRVSGTVTNIYNTTYGNWWLVDATGSICIYGTLDAKGNTKNFTSLGLEEGDEVTVEGPKTTYNGTVELVDVTVISIKKSLVKIEEQTTKALDANGGDFTVRLTVSGDGPFIDIDADWLGISSIVKTDTTTNVQFHVTKNEGEATRKANISFTSTAGKNKSTVSATLEQTGQQGTLTNPFTVAQAVEYCKTHDGTSASEFYVRGKISKVNEVSMQYGNANFNISDDGTNENTVTCFRALFVGGEKFTAEDQISVGDEVLMVGKLVYYNNTTPELAAGCYIHELLVGPRGNGTLESPFNPAAAKAYIDNGGTDDVYVKGIVSQIASGGEFGAEYGNGTFWISNDGKYHGNNPEQDFEAYRVLWLGNRKWAEGDAQIAVGDEVILYGQLTKYKTTYETVQGKAYIYSLNGKTE